MTDWIEAPLGALVSFQKGRKVDTSPESLPGYERYLGASGLEGRPDGFASTRMAVTASGTDVLMLWDGERSGLVGHGQTGVVASTVSRLSPNGEVSGRYLYYALAHQFDWIQNRRTGSGVPHVPKEIARILRIRYPRGASHQQRIANILTSIDNAIEATEALIEKHQQIKAGLMHDLFTRGVLATGELRPRRSEVPGRYREQDGQWLPLEWQYERLDNLALRGSGHTPNKSIPEYWNGGIKWISLADSHRLDALYISDTELKISPRGIQNSSAVLHPAGSVVLSRDAGVGKSAITTEPMAVSQHFMCWKCDHRLDNHFLYYWLQFQKRTFENIAMGSTILTIGLPYFKKLRIACPVDLDEQRAISARAKSADESIFAMQRHLAKLRTQKLGLMQDLLTGKVPVKLPEPAVPA